MLYKTYCWAAIPDPILWTTNVPYEREINMLSSIDNNFMICLFDVERFSIESRSPPPFFVTLYTASLWSNPNIIQFHVKCKHNRFSLLIWNVFFFPSTRPKYPPFPEIKRYRCRESIKKSEEDNWLNIIGNNSYIHNPEHLGRMASSQLNRSLLCPPVENISKFSRVSFKQITSLDLRLCPCIFNSNKWQTYKTYHWMNKSKID